MTPEVVVPDQSKNEADEIEKRILSPQFQMCDEKADDSLVQYREPSE